MWTVDYGETLYADKTLFVIFIISLYVQIHHECNELSHIQSVGMDGWD